MKFEEDGMQVRAEGYDEAQYIIMKAIDLGFHYGYGECGLGLYSPSWDRLLGEFDSDEFVFNPSLIYKLDLSL